MQDGKFGNCRIYTLEYSVVVLNFFDFQRPAKKILILRNSLASDIAFSAFNSVVFGYSIFSALILHYWYLIRIKVEENANTFNEKFAFNFMSHHILINSKLLTE